MDFPDVAPMLSYEDVVADAYRWLDDPFVVDGVYVRVSDIQAHFDRATAGGATILSPVEDNQAAGQRQYRAEDPEGHRWMFAEPL
jgi:Glyoxalase/Bleomycin resistance protein/Dioxygenase superfamily